MRVIAAILLVTTATPLVAQVERPAPRVPTIDSRAPRPETWREEAAIRADVRDGHRAGQIDRNTARGLRRDAAATEALADRFRVGGISAPEQREIDARVEVQRAQVNAARIRGK